MKRASARIAARIPFTSNQRLTVAARQGWKCNHCQKLLTAHFNIDHIQPLASHGLHVSENWQALCLECHAVKTAHECDSRVQIVTSKYFDPRSKDYNL